jgi:hypothetical protein
MLSWRSCFTEGYKSITITLKYFLKCYYGRDIFCLITGVTKDLILES